VADLISVIVSTYNRPDALDACLRALSVQTDQHFEIVVADDGSQAATGRLVTEWARRWRIAIKHAWHEDRGFRLAEIRNRALRISEGSYCVFLDGDCLARPDFVAAHRKLAEPGWFVTGHRLLLSRELTERILADGLAPERWGLADWVAQRARRNVNRLTPLLLAKMSFLRRLQPRRWQGARGSNMAFWRHDLDAVDGFDAAFSGWGWEDTDIFIRLIRNNVFRKDGAGTAVLHLWHPEADRSRFADNERQVDALLAGNRVRAQQGLSSIVKDAARLRPQPEPAR